MAKIAARIHMTDSGRHEHCLQMEHVSEKSRVAPCVIIMLTILLSWCSTVVVCSICCTLKKKMQTGNVLIIPDIVKFLTSCSDVAMRMLSPGGIFY